MLWALTKRRRRRRVLLCLRLRPVIRPIAVMWRWIWSLVGKPQGRSHRRPRHRWETGDCVKISPCTPLHPPSHRNIKHWNVGMKRLRCGSQDNDNSKNVIYFLLVLTADWRAQDQLGNQHKCGNAARIVKQKWKGTEHWTKYIYIYMPDFMFPPRSWWQHRCSGLLRSK
jgi:hypothetical protein